MKHSKPPPGNSVQTVIIDAATGMPDADKRPAAAAGFTGR